MSTPDYDIIMLALPRWDGPYSSTAYSLAKELSLHTRVFYIDNPFTYKDYFRGKSTEQIARRKRALLRGEDIFSSPESNYPRLTAVTPRLMLPINWLPAGRIYDLLSSFNDRVLGRALEKIIRTYDVKRFIFINSFNPLFGRRLPAGFKPDLTVYHSVDDISQSEYVAKHGTYLEEEQIRKADLTVVTSSELRRLKSAISPQVHLLPNAADVSLFQRAMKEDLPVPEEILKIGPVKKIICYTGNICHRLDYELLVKIAKNNPDKVLLMIGPLANDNYRKAGLDKMENVVFAGRKKITELPAYLKYSHCCIIPFLCNPLTRSIYPLKINEYLSAGKPVVTTNFSADIATFGEVAAVSGDHAEFLANIEKVIAEDNGHQRTQRMQYAAGNNWSGRAAQFIDIINSCKNGRKG
jgi:glycosyltransferase involved in cell wall biosynthesis